MLNRRSRTSSLFKLSLLHYTDPGIFRVIVFAELQLYACLLSGAVTKLPNFLQLLRLLNIWSHFCYWTRHCECTVARDL